MKPPVRVSSLLLLACQCGLASLVIAHAGCMHVALQDIYSTNPEWPAGVIAPMPRHVPPAVPNCVNGCNNPVLVQSATDLHHGWIWECGTCARLIRN